MEVKPGFKQTDVGIIPEEWDLTKLGDGIALLSGHHILASRCNTRGVGVPYITGPADFPDGAISHSKFTDRPATVCKPGDILVTVKGSGAGSLVVADAAYCISRQLMAIRASDWDKSFVFYSLLQNATQFKAASTGLIPGLSRSDIIEQLLPLPPLPEQRAIAAALSDVDVLLCGLDRLIAKKRDLNQAAMQQLLTGQTRLPGFHGEWELKRLGDHVMFLRNGVNSRAELMPEGPVKYLHYGDVHARTGVTLAPQLLPSLPSEKATRLDRLGDGDLIFADASEDVAGVSKSVEMRDVAGTEVVAGLHTIAARFDKLVLADGFKAYLQFCPPFANHLRRLAAGTKVFATNRAHIASVEMRLPSVEEQAAIAQVFDDMNRDIHALESRRDKTRDLKLAMMQELLTGRTRLLPTGAAHA